MRFVDELYDYYKNRLLADDEDIDILVASLMQEFSREDMLLLLAELNYNELYQITGNYITEELRKRMLEDQSSETVQTDKSSFYH